MPPPLALCCGLVRSDWNWAAISQCCGSGISCPTGVLRTSSFPPPQSDWSPKRDGQTHFFMLPLGARTYHFLPSIAWTKSSNEENALCNYLIDKTSNVKCSGRTIFCIQTTPPQFLCITHILEYFVNTFFIVIYIYEEMVASMITLTVKHIP